jgi:hypothetical protein
VSGVDLSQAHAEAEELIFLQEALLFGSDDFRERLEAERGWTVEAIERLGLGFDGERIVFPVRESSGALVGYVRYLPGARNGVPKMIADAGTTRELFPPPEMIGEDEGDGICWLGEGEPDNVRAWSLGLAAVAVPGAQNWRAEWAPRFTGRKVVVCFDCDEPGRASAARAAADLTACGIQARIVDLDPSREDGFDLTDFTAKAQTEAEREQARQLLLEMADRAPAVWVEELEHAEAIATDVEQAAPLHVVLTARELCALPDPPVSDELLGPLVVRGQRVALGAHTGEGKSTMGLQIMRAVLLGEDFLGWKGSGDVRALVIDAEQGLKTVKRRLREAGLDECEQLDYLRVPDGLALDSNERDAAELEDVLAAGDHALVFAGPLYKLHRGDSNEERAAVDLMRRFDRWRELHGFGLLTEVHLRKPPPQGSRFTIHDFFGSSAYQRGAEVVLGLQRVRAGYGRLHFFKDRDGDLPIGERWGLLFDREEGFRRDPKDTGPSIRERVRELREADPSLTQPQVAAELDVSERTVRKYWHDEDADPDDGQGSLLDDE